MIKIRGILKTKNINTPVEYRVIESDKKILRVTDTETQSWYDLRPILEDTVAFENISKEVKNKEHLTNRHGYGIVASHGIFSYEDCDFLVTDAFGGKSLDTFLSIHFPLKTNLKLVITTFFYLWKKSQKPYQIGKIFMVMSMAIQFY